MVLPKDERMNIDKSQELRDALFHAICLLDHSNPENDTDHRDVAAARELANLRDLLNKQACEAVETSAGEPAAKRRATR